MGQVVFGVNSQCYFVSGIVWLLSFFVFFFFFFWGGGGGGGGGV
jgi:hypothetical protein